MSTQSIIAKDTEDVSAFSLPQLSRNWRRVIRIGWMFAFILSLVILILAIPAGVVAVEQGMIGHGTSNFQYNTEFVPTTADRLLTLGVILVGLVATLISLFLAAVLFKYRSDNAMAVFTSFFLLWTGIITSGPLEALEYYIPGMANFTTDLLMSIWYAVFVIALMSLFPNGKFVPRWTRWTVLVSLILAPVYLLLYLYYGALYSTPLEWFVVPFWIMAMATAFYAQYYRYRYASTPEERSQAGWFIFSVVTWIILSSLSGIPYHYLRSAGPDEGVPILIVLLGLAFYLPALLIMPIVLTYAVLRQRLWGIGIFINRTLVYVSLTALVVGLYVLIVGTLGTLFQSADVLISLVGTGVVAMVFQPLRERLQRNVNRMMFGKRDEPYAVLEHLSERLNLVVQTEQMLPTIAETIAVALKLPYVAISFQKGDQFEVVAQYQSEDRSAVSDNDCQILPLIYQMETVGQLLLAPRGSGEVFSQQEFQLLEMIARQTSIAAYNVRLTSQLQRSREQLVTAREEERRRLRRDLHDGLGPVLATICVGMDAIRNLADNPSAVRDTSVEIKTQTQNALEDIRRIAYNLRPPALDELGLIAAVQQHLRSASYEGGLQMIFDEPERLPTLPAAVEVAAYRILLEALSNVQRHAKARHCHIRLSYGDYLYLEIIDDGCGVPSSYVAGVGLQSMRERTTELGGHFAIKPLSNKGGTIILAQLPLPRQIDAVMG